MKTHSMVGPWPVPKWAVPTGATPVAKQEMPSKLDPTKPVKALGGHPIRILAWDGGPGDVLIVEHHIGGSYRVHDHYQNGVCKHAMNDRYQLIQDGP